MLSANLQKRFVSRFFTRSRKLSMIDNQLFGAKLLHQTRFNHIVFLSLFVAFVRKRHGARLASVLVAKQQILPIFYIFGQRPRQGTKSCRIGRNSVRPFVRPSVRSPVRPSARPFFRPIV